MDVGLWGRDGDRGILSNVSDHNHFVPDPPGLSAKRVLEALGLHEHSDQQEETVQWLRETRASGDHVWRSETPGPTLSNRSEREC